MMSASAFVLRLDGVINTQTKQKEQSEEYQLWRDVYIYVSFIKSSCVFVALY